MNLLLSNFTNYLKKVKYYSDATIKSYNSDLTSFSSFLYDVYDISDLTSVKVDFIRSYLVYLKELGLVSNSINRKISSIKSFYNYCQDNGLVEVNPAMSISNLRKAERLPVFVNEIDIKTYLENEELDIIDKVILVSLYTTGIRRSELINLKVNDIDFVTQKIRILGKGNKYRIVPLSSYLSSVLKEYISGRRFQSEFLIVTKKGNKAYPKYIYTIVNRHLSNLGLDKSSPHVLRHSFATHILNNGADLNAVKDLLGHSSLSATQIYTHNSLNQLKKTHKINHPKG